MAATVDLFPTISNLADVLIPTDRIIDGVDMSPILFEDEIVCNLYIQSFTTVLVNVVFGKPTFWAQAIF